MPVLLGPDGALYVGDWATGTVYRIASLTRRARAREKSGGEGGI